MKSKYVSTEECREVAEMLDMKAAAGSLDEHYLHQAFVIFDDSTTWRSVGVHWVEQHPDLFGRFVKDPEAFLRQHFDTPSCLSHLICISEVLQLIPGERLENFLRDAYVHCGASMSDWTQFALELGISPKVTAGMILDRLQKMDPRSDGWYTFFHGDDGIREIAGASGPYRLQLLLDPGPEIITFEGRPHRRCYRDNGQSLRTWYIALDRAWGIFTDDEFMVTMKVCARKRPDLVLANRDKIGLRLDETKAAALCVEAAEYIESLEMMERSDFKELPLQSRLGIARRLKQFEDKGKVYLQAPTLRFLLGLMTELGGQDNVRQFFRQLEPIFASIQVTTLAQKVATWIYEQDVRPYDRRSTSFQPPTPMSQWFWLWQYVVDRLLENHYIVGCVEEGSFIPRGRTQPMRQHQVHHGHTLYVHDRFAHRYYPANGDHVLIYGPSSQFLARNSEGEIRRAYFVPLDRNKDPESRD